MKTKIFKSMVRRLVGRYVGISFEHPWAVIALFALAASLAGWVSYSRLEITTDLSALLPEGAPSVTALEESKRRIGSTDFFVIAIESADKDPVAIAKAQDLLAGRIEEEWSDALWTQVDRDTSFFREHALYYFSQEKLGELRDIIEEELIRESANSIPGMVNLIDDDVQKPVEMSTRISQWCDPDDMARLGLPPQIEDELSGYFSKDASTPGDSVARSSNSALPEEYRDRLIGPEGDVGVVLIQLKKPSTDLEYARLALDRGQRLIDTIDLASVDDGLFAQVVGAYRSFREVDSVSADGKLATSVSVVLILALLIAFFRSFRAVAIIFLPLGVAGAFTMALTSLSFGRLTVLTVFVLAMLAGMGIDYGVHLYGRIRQESRLGLDAEKATFSSILDTGGAVIAAAATTIASLLILLTGHFEGFKEFGVVASYGLAICVLTTITMMPALVAAFTPRRSVTASPGLPETTRRGFSVFFFARLSRWSHLSFAAGLIATVALGFFIKDVTFEKDFRNLRGPSTGATIRYGRAIGKKASTTPAVILGRDRRQMRSAHDYLIAHLDDPSVASFITLHTFVPPRDEQARRHEIVGQIGELVNKRAMNRLRGRSGFWIAELRRMTTATPFDEGDLPDWALRILTEGDGTVGNIGHLYANVEDWNADSVLSFQRRFAFLTIDGDHLSIANSAFILADVVRMVQADGRRLLLLVSAAILAILLLYARSIRGAVAMIFAVACSAVWTTGLMGLLGLRIGLYNIIVIPVILGVSIDTAIHLYHRHLCLGATGLARNLADTGTLVTISSWTTICGFLGLLFVSHLGLRTIGQLACIGVGSSWLSIMMIFPFILKIFVPARELSPEVTRDQRYQQI